MGGNDAPKETWKAGPKSPYIWAIKNLKHGKRASQVRDGLNTVFDFEVLISLGPEIAQTLKTRKCHFSEAPFRYFSATFNFSGHVRIRTLGPTYSCSGNTVPVPRRSSGKHQCLTSWANHEPDSRLSRLQFGLLLQ
jgi:hypothetical protein